MIVSRREMQRRLVVVVSYSFHAKRCLVQLIMLVTRGVPLSAAHGFDSMDTSHADPSPLDLAFHGSGKSGHASVDSILQHGMLPAYRKSNGDWFSRSVNGSLMYALTNAGGRKVLVAFLLLVLPPAYVSDNGQVVVMRDANYELPVAAITVC